MRRPVKFKTSSKTKREEARSGSCVITIQILEDKALNDFFPLPYSANVVLRWVDNKKEEIRTFFSN